MRVVVLGGVVALAVGAAPVAGQDFWAHWGDGQAEMSAYRLKQPRYGAVRDGRAVLIFVTEDFSDALRVKSETGERPPEDVYPVLKLNHVRDFQTGIYDYNVMTSSFVRVRHGWPLVKVSFSSQEWCGHVYQQLVPREGRATLTWHSYFEREADGERVLSEPEGGIHGDTIPMRIRAWLGEWLAPGESRSVPWLPTSLDARLRHQPQEWGRARVSRAASSHTVEVPAGRFEVEDWVVAVEGAETTTWWVESGSPWRVVGWSRDDGERGELLGSERIAYWKLNQPGGEERLKGIGLEVP